MTEDGSGERHRGTAGAALILGPALTVAAFVSVFLPLRQFEILIAIVLLALSPAVLSLAWLPAGSPSRARSVAAVTAAMVGAAIGWVGFHANPCAADPTTVGVTAIVLSVGTFLIAIATGRYLAGRGRVVPTILAAGVVGFVGYLVTGAFVLPQVFVLC